MATESAATSDKGIGFTVLFTIVAVAAAVVLAMSDDSLVSGVGFAGAMLFASLAVVAIHAYWH